MPPIRTFLFAAIVSSQFCLADENWPVWRGPRGDGTVENAPNLPTAFDITTDTVWKTPIDGIGHASPIIWENRIFLVSANEEKETRSLICLERTSGKILWEKVALKTPFEGIHRLNSRSSSTPVTDGKTVFVSFLDESEMYVAAFDFEGKKLWEKRPGVFSSKHGYCSCPILWNGKVIINGDHDGDAYIVALDQKTGDEIWKTDRPNKTRSYCTPIIRKIGDRTQMILSGSMSVASYDPDTGKQHWVIDGPTEQYVASLVYNEQLNLLFLTCGFPEKHMLAIDPSGSGNVTDTHVKWRHTAGASYVPSPIAIGDYFLVVADNGVASCFDAKTGERFWRERLLPKEAGDPGHSASMISANGLAYFTADSGYITVVKPGPELEIVAQSQIGEEVYASPAIFGNQLFIRGEENLFCIGK
ncbi:PQQ-binding-like beta-propeller repeat protein [Verrucomicrobiales bacterium]|nr:PQQ-binding-like beta-propeller repeat protein [Verrucomicrobiales bacterium]